MVRCRHGYYWISSTKNWVREAKWLFLMTLRFDVNEKLGLVLAHLHLIWELHNDIHCTREDHHWPTYTTCINKGSRQSWAAYYNKGTFHWAATASSSGTKKEVEGMMLPAILFLLVAMEMAEHCSATQKLFPASPGGNHILQKVRELDTLAQHSTA